MGLTMISLGIVQNLVAKVAKVKHYLNLMYQLMKCLSIGQVAFAIHLAQKVVVIIELEQWVYQLMVAPVTHL